MRGFALVVLTGAIGLGLTATSPTANAQVGVGVEIGAPPVCPYGYYDVAPYNCAPYGYYGPEWFSGGVFMGVGPWFHGEDRFVGHVNNRFHPDHGYKGPLPARGEAASHPVDRIEHFRGNEMRDGRGHVARR